MNEDENYKEVNKASWNQKVASHLSSEFYDLDSFLAGKSSLNSIELDLLGNLEGKSVLHLQCHFGQDTFSLERLGANVTGVDFSENAIHAAQDLAKNSNSSARFICCGLYDLPQLLNEEFDFVFTSYGTIGWLPDLDKWAALINRFLKPGGSFVFAEFHPVVWMFDADFETIEYRYFKSDAIIETESGSYADRESTTINKSITWNHGLGEVFQALIQRGLSISSFQEFDYSPYNCFKNTIEFEPHKFRIKSLENKIPMVYALKAEKMIK